MSGSLRLYNTLTRSKEVFEPIDPKNVRVYVCGPTVYDYAHIGNARPVIVFDVLFRLLRHIYGEDHVVYARNITDVDDKINARAAQDFPGLPLNEAIAKVTAATEKQFHDDVAALGCLPPTYEPRATEHIEEMKALIERLVARGLAYVAEDNVLFSPTAMDRLPNSPRYGSLARRSLDEMLAGARVDVAPYKRDPMDFVLWKPSKLGEPGWPSPCGIVPLGRPGWHIECSAMSMAKLLAPFGGGLSCDDPAKNVFDIHGGGIDLVFPHHENEIAQSCCAFSTPRMANYWMHNGFLQVEGEKMSKSLGNFVTIRELLNRRPGDRSWGEILRLNMLKTHYRQPIDWTEKSLLETEVLYAEFKRAVINGGKAEARISDELIEALSDDLNTHGAITEMIALAKRAKSDKTGDQPASAANNLVGSLIFLGFDRAVSHVRETRGVREEILRAIAETDAKASGLDVVDIEALVAQRNTARQQKNFKESDRLREELSALGIEVKDNKDGTATWSIKHLTKREVKR